MNNNVDKDTQIRYLESAHMIGFGLWWTVLLVAAFLPDEDISQTGRMWLVIITMSYGALVIGATFWSGYSKKERELVNADPNERRQRVSRLWPSAAFGFVFMLIYWLITGEGDWIKALLQAMFFAVFTTLATYLMTLRKLRREKAPDEA
jgi:hypothetical protein